MCFAYIKLTAEIYKQKQKLSLVLFIVLSKFHYFISQSGDSVRKTPLYLYPYLTLPRYVLVVKPKSNSKSQILVPNPSPKSK